MEISSYYKMPTRLSLAQQIAQLDVTAPVDLDPEDVHFGDRAQESHSEDEGDIGGGREHYLDVGPSIIRRLHDSVADPKYAGEKTTRKQLLEEAELEPHMSDEDAHAPSDGDPDEDANESSEDDKPSDHDDDMPPATSADIPASARLPPQDPPEQGTDLQTTLRTTRERDRIKGKAISKQLALYDGLLDARIRLQKSVTSANKLGTFSVLADVTAAPPAVRESLARMLKETSALSEELFDFQQNLFITNKSIESPPRKKRKVNQDPSVSVKDLEADVNQAMIELSSLEYAAHAHRLQILNKWSSKILSISPSLLVSSTKPSFSMKSLDRQGSKGAVLLIDEVLTNLEKLRARTRIMRTGGTADNIEDGNGVFDDTDFYQSLLRDIIASKTGEEDWAIEQTRKRKEKKKVVDTKASKGRKLGYDVHEKLQNFMVPVPVMHGGWHEEQIDELFSSLFGESV